MAKDTVTIPSFSVSSVVTTVLVALTAVLDIWVKGHAGLENSLTTATGIVTGLHILGSHVKKAASKITGA
jgi:hypothetical protein